MADVDDRLLAESAEDLYENAPCGYLSTDPAGRVIKVNATFLDWTGYSREELLDGPRFPDLLSAGGRIYYETHFAPMLQGHGSVKEVAVEIVRADGSLLPALVNASLKVDEHARPQLARITVFDATDRRGYEQELLAARRREQDIAQELQRSMLWGALPTADGLEIGVAYSPAVQGLRVGGDWYDAFWLETGACVGLVVGDVVGRGIPAAATMGQLRSAVRALASTGLPPAALLEALDRYARRHDVGLGTTLALGWLDLGSGAISLARAGHLPPVIVEPGEKPRLEWDGLSAPLDVHVEAEVARAQVSLELKPGSLIVLYTDGLVERRSWSLDDGMRSLLAEVAERCDEAAQAIADGLVRALRDPADTDDVCVVVVRTPPA